MNIADLDGKPFTLWLTDEQNESSVFPGIARWNGSDLILDRGGNVFEIRTEWHDRIRAVANDDVRRILQGADYFLRLYVGDLPQDVDDDSYERTGLKWPK